MNRIIECRLDSTYKEIYTGIWQHDYGQILRITGADLPKAVEVQFSLEDNGGDTLTRIGTTADGATEVKVPDSLLKNENCTQNYLIYAWIYVTDDTSGNTEYQIILHVKSRPKPEEPTEEPLPEPNIFHETVKAVNDAADRAEQADQNAKASATEAGKYAASASESAVAAEKNKEDALREVGEKKQKAIEAIQEQEETSVGKIINHTDDEIKRLQNQTAESKGELEQTITNADTSKEELDESIQTAGDTKKALDKSTELAGTAKTEMDASTQKAGEAKTALDGSTKTAGEMQETLRATVKQAGALDTSLSEKIETGTQLKTDLVASGEKAVQDIQAAGSEQLDKMKAVAEEFTADREQIATNKENIGSLKEDIDEIQDTNIKNICFVTDTSNRTIGGMDILFNEDGSITIKPGADNVNGIAQEDIHIFLMGSSDFKTYNLSPGTYTFTRWTAKGKGNVRINNYYAEIISTKGTNKISITKDITKDARIAIQIAHGEEVNGTFYFQIERGNVGTDYQKAYKASASDRIARENLALLSEKLCALSDDNIKNNAVPTDTSTRTIGGMDISFGYDGSITICPCGENKTGIATDNIFIYINGGENKNDASVKRGIYTITRYTLDGTGDLRVQNATDNSTIISGMKKEIVSETITLNEDSAIYFAVYKGTAVNGTFKIQIEEGLDSTEYEPPYDVSSKDKIARYRQKLIYEDLKNIKSVCYGLTSFSMFENFAVVGDSYASGQLWPAPVKTAYNVSWGQILARISGSECTNLSSGGVSTHSWLFGYNGVIWLDEMKKESPRQLYLLFLGINDVTSSDTVIGDITDIDTHADTFYGNYGKIIKEIKTYAPKSKIIISTIANHYNYTRRKQFNEAIENIAKHFGIPLIVQDDDLFFHSDFYLDNMTPDHPRAPVYAGMAVAIKRLIEKSMIENLAYFLDYQYV